MKVSKLVDNIHFNNENKGYDQVKVMIDSDNHNIQNFNTNFLTHNSFPMQMV